MVYSGYTLPELRERVDAARLLATTDLLVDGRYDRTHPEPPPPVGRRWLGSTNQVMHFFTSAYSANDPQMRTPNTVELHWKDGRLLINGWPAGADALAKIRRVGER
jgi:anaerobic ribonucleoside-triphosphate reductase activating protein